MKRRLKTFACLHDDINEGLVWLQDESLPPRSIVRIRSVATRKSVRCEALQIDHNFLRLYNQKPRVGITEPRASLVISSWYRAKLGGLQTQSEYDLEISISNTPWGKLRASTQHPQAALRVAVWLGILSILIGLAGFKPWAWFQDEPQPAIGASEWVGLVHDDPQRGTSSTPVTREQLLGAPRFSLLLDCASWGRTVLGPNAQSFECATGCRLDSITDTVACKDSTWLTR
jgi:hypothetical protein